MSKAGRRAGRAGERTDLAALVAMVGIAPVQFLDRDFMGGPPLGPEAVNRAKVDPSELVEALHLAQ